jgi:hypothetical protein
MTTHQSSRWCTPHDGNLHGLRGRGSRADAAAEMQAAFLLRSTATAVELVSLFAWGRRTDSPPRVRQSTPRAPKPSLPCKLWAWRVRGAECAARSLFARGPTVLGGLSLLESSRGLFVFFLFVLRSPEISRVQQDVRGEMGECWHCSGVGGEWDGC